jgi:hypothetical protein
VEFGFSLGQRTGLIECDFVTTRGGFQGQLLKPVPAL